MALTQLLRDSNRVVGVLDGGLATHLETALGQDLTSSLWSAALLDDDTPRTDGSLNGVQAIMRAHTDFLEAGADIIESCNYQAAEETFAKLGLSRKKARKLMLRSVDLAVRARDDFVASAAGQARLAAGNARPLVALSLGPYGAMLGNGAEYTGDYPSMEDPDVGVSEDELEAFHQRRLECFVGTPQWEHIDLIAFETIPRLDEIVAVRGAMLEVAKKAGWAPGTPRKDVLISVVFPNGRNLPFPVIKDINDDDDSTKDLTDDDIRIEEWTEILRETFNADYESDDSEENQVEWPVTALGINCTKPHFIGDLVFALWRATSEQSFDPPRHLFLYPDGGQVWDGEARVWKADPDLLQDDPWADDSEEEDTHKVDSPSEKWAKMLRRAAKRAIKSERWAGVWLGGCCKAGDVEISKLRELAEPK